MYIVASTQQCILLSLSSTLLFRTALPQHLAASRPPPAFSSAASTSPSSASIPCRPLQSPFSFTLADDAEKRRAYRARERQVTCGKKCVPFILLASNFATISNYSHLRSYKIYIEIASALATDIMRPNSLAFLCEQVSFVYISLPLTHSLCLSASQKQRTESVDLSIACAGRHSAFRLNFQRLPRMHFKTLFLCQRATQLPNVFRFLLPFENISLSSGEKGSRRVFLRH